MDKCPIFRLSMDVADEKLPLDFAALSAPLASTGEVMRAEQRRSIIALAARAGAMLENVSADAILLGDRRNAELISILTELRASIGQADNLLDEAIRCARQD